MARTRVAGQLRDAASMAQESWARGVEVDQVLEERSTTRRELLRDVGALALGVAAFGRFHVRFIPHAERKMHVELRV